MSSYQCPHCHSLNTQSFEMVYKNGISHIDANTGTVGISNNGHGGAVSKTKGTEQTELSKSVAPPEEQSVIANLLGGCLLSFILFIVFIVVFGVILDFNLSDNWIYVFVFLGIGLAFLGVYMAIDYNEKDYPLEIARWKHSFLCMRCGQRFVVGNYPTRKELEERQKQNQ